MIQHQSNKTQWRLIFVLWFCGMGASMQFAKVSLAFDELQAYYQASEGEIGVVLSWVGVCGMILAAGVSVFIARFGYRRLLFLAMILAAGLAVYQISLPSLSVLLVTRLVEGLAHLIIVVTAPTLMVAACAADKRSMVMSLWGTFFGVTFALVGALAPWLIELGGVRSLFIFHALWMLVMLALLALTYRHELIPLPSVPAVISIKSLYQQHLRIYGSLPTILPSLCFINYTALYVALLTFFPKIGGAGPLWLPVVLPLISLVGAFLVGVLIQHGMTPIKATQMAFGSAMVVFIALSAVSALDIDVSWFKVVVFFTLGLMQGAIYGMIPYLSKQSHQQAQSISAIAQLGILVSTFGPPLLCIAFVWLCVSSLLGASFLLLLTGLLLATILPKRLNATVHL